MQTSTERKSGHLLLLLPISSAFAHTHCISPSVCLLKSFMQASTSLLRGRRGRSRAAHRFSSALPSAGRSLPLFFCNQKKSRKTVKEKFRPLPSRSRVRLPPKGGINAPPETVWFLISTASPTGSRAVFQFPSDARPPKVLRTSRGYYFNNSAKGARLSRRLSRDWRGEKCVSMCPVGHSTPAVHGFSFYAPSNSALILQFVYILSIAPP